MDSGGVKDHISWIVTATNTHSGQDTPISAQETCTVCVQNPTSDFEPGCSGKDPGSEKNGNQYVCDASCPQCELQCGIQLLETDGMLDFADCIETLIYFCLID